jgi:alpha-galactosidase
MHGLPAVSTTNFISQGQDLWAGTQFQAVGSISANNVAPHGTAVFHISSNQPITPTGQIFNTASLHCLTLSGTNVA